MADMRCCPRPQQKRKYAAASLETNCGHATFRKLFPELVELQQQREEELRKLAPADNASASSSSGLGPLNDKQTNDDWSLVLGVGTLVLVLSVVLMFWYS